MNNNNIKQNWRSTHEGGAFTCIPLWIRHCCISNNGSRSSIHAPSNVVSIQCTRWSGTAGAPGFPSAGKVIRHKLHTVAIRRMIYVYKTMHAYYICIHTHSSLITDLGINSVNSRLQVLGGETHIWGRGEIRCIFLMVLYFGCFSGGIWDPGVGGGRGGKSPQEIAGNNTGE